MLTLNAARAHLAADGPDALATIARAAGFEAPPLLLHRELSDALGLTGLARAAHIVTGSGALRALLVRAEPGLPLRERLAAIARQLDRRAPHLLWLLVADSEHGELAIAAWSGGGRAPRIAALLAHRARVLPSDAETLRALAGGGAEGDVLTHARWTDVLGRQALTRRFYRELEAALAALAAAAVGRATPDQRRAHALTDISRLLFLVFLQAKGWLDGDERFLERRFLACMSGGGRFHRRVMLPLFFGTLNTPPQARAAAARALGRIPFLNGGLFARTALERRVKLHYPDAAVGDLLGGLFARYRFTAREGSASWSEAAVDPEMLGKAFENLMAPAERRTSGAYYTPQPIVHAVTHAALRQALTAGPELADAADRALRGEPLRAGQRAPLAARLRDVRLVDPACGSGAFLVHALETMAELALRLGDARPVPVVRREMLTRAIFGVDLNPMAVWLCELRLWLSVVIESEETDPLAVPPLPNLDRNIRVGDALDGAGMREGDTLPRGGGALGRLRERYARATGARKRTLQRALERAERTLAIASVDASLARVTARRRDVLAAMRGRDLFGERAHPARADRAAVLEARVESRELRIARRALASGGALPFAWPTHFPEIPRRGGFDVVLGNPPWVRLHHIAPAARVRLRARYAAFRAAAWERGAAAARSGAGFAAQVDLAALFLERALQLLRPGGTLALLLPAKLWRSLAGGGARRLVTQQAHVLALEDWSRSRHAFDAAVYPSLLVARARERADAPSVPVAVAMHRRDRALRWQVRAERLGLDDDPASPWIALPPEVRDALDRVSRAGIPLADSSLGPPLLGVKCGCNEAFVVEHLGGSRALAEVRSGERRGAIEREMLRPLLRGESVARWRAVPGQERVVWTHAPHGAPLRTLPPHALHWLSRWRHALDHRADAHAGAWWQLFRTAAARTDRSRVVWADVAREPRALVLPPGDPVVPLNTCYVLACANAADAAAFTALLNAPLAAAWLGAIAEPARGGYRRFLAWTVALLPIPRDWERARALLAPIADRAMRGDHVTADELLDAALRAYRVRRADVAALLEWNGG